MTLTGLIAGHTYYVQLTSVNSSGEGYPVGPPPTIPGFGQPSAPTLTSATAVGPNTADLTWSPVGGAAAYLVSYEDLTHSAGYQQMPYPVTGSAFEVDYLIYGATNYSFCLQAVNGTTVSASGNCLRAHSAAQSSCHSLRFV